MTTNKDIVFEKLMDAVITCYSKDLMTEQEYTFLKEDVETFVENIEEQKATKEQVEWNLETKI